VMEALRLLHALLALAFALLALSREREHRKKLRLAARAKRMEDEKLKAEIASRQAKYERAIDQASTKH